MAHKNTDTFIAEMGTAGNKSGDGESLVGLILINVAYVAVVVALFLIQA